MQVFVEAGYAVTFLPVLQFVFKNAELLQAALSSPSSYCGLVATSPRGCLAVSRAFAALSSSLSAAAFASLIAQWSAVPFYTVGEASASLLSSSGPLPLTLIAVGGNAAALARAIGERRNRAAADDGGGGGGGGAPLPLLVLSGTLRREELFDGLRAAAVPFRELQVYDTESREGLVEDAERAVPPPVEGTEAGSEQRDAHRWLVFFSPSGVEALRCALLLHERSGGFRRLRGWRLAAIGNTTAQALTQVTTPPTAF